MIILVLEKWKSVRNSLAVQWLDFHCRGIGFHPKDPACHTARPKNRSNSFIISTFISWLPLVKKHFSYPSAFLCVLLWIHKFVLCSLGCNPLPTLFLILWFSKMWQTEFYYNISWVLLTCPHTSGKRCPRFTMKLPWSFSEPDISARSSPDSF